MLKFCAKEYLLVPVGIILHKIDHWPIVTVQVTSIQVTAKYVVRVVHCTFSEEVH